MDPKALNAGMAALAAAAAPVSAQTDVPPRYQIPSTVSPEAAEGMRQWFSLMASAPRPAEPPRSVADWDRQYATAEGMVAPLVAGLVQQLGVTIRPDTIGGVPVLRIVPAGYVPRRRTLIYAHGGAYVLYSATTTAVVPSLIARATGMEVISVDYTRAPRGTWRTVPDQVIAVYKAVLADGHRPDQVGMFGDSAGGGLVAGAVLKMRDDGVPLPAALYLISPWTDITTTGDTYATLADADPLLMAGTLATAAGAYAPPADQKHPYVSPVYGDYAKPFPPTLIQGGTREIFLSNFVREYQAILSGGHEAILDLYEGMPHVFQALLSSAPETRTSIARAATFFDRHLAKDDAASDPTRGSSAK